jgi:alkylresorcinol/alkylpyrone synthase
MKMQTRARILSIATAVPSHRLRQQDIAAAASGIFHSRNDFARFLPVYENAAIDTRYSCVPLSWYEKPSPLSERNALYLKHALNLLEKAAGDALKRAQRTCDDIDGIVVVSSTGIATPSLDALLMERLKLKRNIERLPVFGLGCAGGVIGLARTAQLAQGAPQKCYLYLVVELCGLNFLYSDRSKSNIIATALFADGAAAAVVSCKGSGPEISAWSEHTWPDSLEVMGWDVVDDGLKAVFSRDIPSIVRNDMGAITQDFLATYGIGTADISGFLCHPGGVKVLDAIEDALGLAQGSLAHSRDVLRRFGNMSAATVMFVMEEARKDRQRGRYLVTAFGPGFTAAFLLLSVQ